MTMILLNHIIFYVIFVINIFTQAFSIREFCKNEMLCDLTLTIHDLYQPK